MAISEKIKKLIKTLGGVPKSDTIEDAIEDLVGLFTEKREVKMVEIYRTESLEFANYGLAYLNGMPPMVENREYIFELDGTTYTSVYKYNDELGTLACLLYVDDEGYEVVVFMPDEETPVLKCDYNQPTTLTVTEKQVTVTPPAVALPRVEKKMVEIVPEQSVTIVDSVKEINNVINENCTTVTKNSNIYLTVDGKEMKCNFVGVNYGSLGFMTEDEKIVVALNPLLDVDRQGVTLTDMSGEYEGKTLTVKVYTKQEVEKPLAPKFVGGYVITNDDTGNLTFNKTYTELLDLFNNNPPALLNIKFMGLYGDQIDILCVECVTKNEDNIGIQFKAGPTVVVDENGVYYPEEE